MRRLSLFFVSLVLLTLRLGAAGVSAPLGVVYSGQEAFIDLVYRNETAVAVAIRRVTSTCDCTTILSSPDVVAPGATARIVAVYRSAKPGSIHTVVEVFGADPAQPVASFHITGFVTEKSWLVSARELMSGPVGEALLVDVRDAGKYERSHPSRALNVPLFSLKSRAALRSRKLVLFDEGHALDVLLAEVLALRKLGFKDVKVLAGGLTAWSREGGTLEGEGKPASRLAVISAAEFDRANSTQPWLCLAVGDSAPVSTQRTPVQRVADVAELPAKLAEASWPVTGGTAFRPILVLLNSAEVQARAEQLLGRDSRQQIYYLEGGAAALASYRQQQAALAQHTGQTFSVQSVKSHAVVSGPCGTCGK